jgi:secreted PhoX family phosphatase
MKDFVTSELVLDDWDELQRPAPETTNFDTVVAAAVSRRGFLCGLATIESGAAAKGLFPGSPAHAVIASRLGFTPIAAQTDGTAHVPEGYSWKIVSRLCMRMPTPGPATPTKPTSSTVRMT